jgi:hypothetical protein
MVKIHRTLGVEEPAERDAGTTGAVTASFARGKGNMRSQFVDWLNDTEKHFPPGMVSRLVTFREGPLLRLVLAVSSLCSAGI